MNVKELLELAAKAAGYHVACWPCRERGFRFGFIHAKDGGSWDPLNDDGDAFRLMVALANKYEDFHSVIWNWTHKDIHVFAGGHEGFGRYECEKLRYAIVYAAAEIGKAME